MQPIKTSNAMNPASAKGIQSLPTPVIDDVIITEVVNAWKGNYEKLEYGTMWDSVPHGSQQGSFPEHKLVFQQVSSEDGQWVKRIWANDRVNQDGYNYAIKYSAGSQEHPIYIRTYVLPRETYAPLLDGTPDPLFPSALLVDEEATRIEGELDSKYITVTRVYETIPGPAVPTRRYNERGDLETVLVQTVPPNTPPDPDGLLVTSSQVEQVETGKGVKTTSTVPDHSLLQIKEKKEGLLGETITTDDIVDPSTNPDALSQTIVSSIVEQFSATKARKRTTTALGPTSLTQKSKDGKLLGDVTLIESIVAPNATPDAVSTSVLSSEIKQIDTGKSVKKNTILNSTPVFSGHQNEQGLLGVKSTVESVVLAGASADVLSLSVISSQVEPIDSVRSKKTTITSLGPTSLSGSQKKEGLLGEVNVVESIVAYGSQPDTLSQTIISSQVDIIDSAKSKKTTITSVGPTSLSQKSKDGKLLGDVTSTESIVAPDVLPDALSATVLSSDVKQIDSGKAIKTNVVLNSTPTLSGNQNEQGLLGNKKTIETIVPAGTVADALSQTILSSQVEPIDSVRSRKVNVSSTGPILLSGGEKKEGLLGEVFISEEIVSAGTSPNQLTTTIVSSIVEPIDASKSKRTTKNSIGPTSLSQKSNDGKLLGNVTSIESVVSPNTLPDAPSTTILSSDVKQIDSGKAIKTNVILNSTPTFIGKQSSEGLLGIKQIVETIVPSNSTPDSISIDVISSIVEPIDSVRSKKTTITATGPTSLFGKQNKEGILGETTTEEKIVPAGSVADTLSTSIISSQVIPIDAAKSKKVTVTSNGPQSLTTKSNDGKLFGNIEVVESVVSPSSNPDDLSGVTSGILQSEVKQIDNGKAIKQTTRLLSTPQFLSESNEPGILGEKTTLETIVAAGSRADVLSQSILSSSVEQIDSQRSKKTTTISLNPTSLIGKKINERGDIETITERIVGNNEPPDQDSFLQTSSEVIPIDSAKSKKTTSTVSTYTKLGIKENNEGLFGNTETEEEIVAVNTIPDALSSTVLSSSVQRISSSKAIKKTTRLSGPKKLVGVQNKEGLLGQTEVTESIVDANTAADPLSLQIVSSIVEPIDSAKSKKTNIKSTGPTSFLGKENKPGLLGNTVKTESIVGVNVNPDELSMSVVQSQVEQIDSAKSKKTTITATGPTSLISRTLTDSPVGTVETIKTNSIVNKDQKPVNSFNTLSYNINAIDSIKSEAEIVEVVKWNTVKGVEFDELTGVPLPYLERVVNPEECDNVSALSFNTQYKPIDEFKVVKKQYFIDEIRNYYTELFYNISTQVSIKLPNKLLGVTAYISRDLGEGKNETNSNNVGGDSYGYTSGGGFRSSGNISAELYFKVENGFDGYVPGKEVVFFMKQDDLQPGYTLEPTGWCQVLPNGGSSCVYGEPKKILNGTILSELNNRMEDVKAWPIIKRITENVIVFTGGKTKTTSTTKSEDVSINGFANSNRVDISYDIDTNANSITLPDALHESIAIEEIKFGPELPNDLQITAGVYPKILTATNPPKFPTGSFLMASSVEIFKWGLVKITAIIADITDEFV